MLDNPHINPEDIMAKQERPLQLDQLAHLTGKQLNDVLAETQRLLQERRGATIQAIRERWQAEVEEEGLTLSDIFPPARDPSKARQRASQGAAPRYRLPTGEEWSGRGRLPQPFKLALDQDCITESGFLSEIGKVKIEQYAIKTD